MMQIYKVFKDNTAFFISNIEYSINNSEQEYIKINRDDNIVDLIIIKSVNNPDCTINILSTNFEDSINELENHYKPKIAAGGWVFNSKNELLFIKRWDIWDIPKGHLEIGETLEECAIREVEEETSIKNLAIVNKLGITRHIFSRKGKEKLKVTHWYKMKTTYDRELKPQTEEDIEEVKWVESSNIETHLENSWKSLKEFYFSNIK